MDGTKVLDINPRMSDKLGMVLDQKSIILPIENDAQRVGGLSSPYLSPQEQGPAGGDDLLRHCRFAQAVDTWTNFNWSTKNASSLMSVQTPYVPSAIPRSRVEVVAVIDSVCLRRTRNTERVSMSIALQLTAYGYSMTQIGLSLPAFP